MRRKTRKYLAAQQTIKQLGDGSKALVKSNSKHDDLYQALEQKGYSWDSDSGTWGKYEVPQNALRVGTLDIRLRMHLGDANEAVKFIGEALEAQGFQFTRVGPINPDDRDGPATSGRV